MRANARWRALAAGLLVAVAAQGSEVLAETYPSRAIRLVVPFPAGGGIDSLARLVGAKLADALGQPVVVENTPGAAGNRATDFVAKAAPDGYTLVVGANSMTINPALQGMRAPDPVRAFAPVTKLVTIPVVVAVTPSFEARSCRNSWRSHARRRASSRMPIKESERRATWPRRCCHCAPASNSSTYRTTARAAWSRM